MAIEVGTNFKFLVCGDTNAPKRNQAEDAGFDVYIPNLTEQFIKDLSDKNPGQPFRWGMVGAPTNEEDIKNNAGVYLYIPAHEDILIPTYIKSKFSNEWVLMARNKSGVCTNQKLTVGADIIDSGYQGQIHIHLFNSSNATRFVEFGQKIAQLIPLRINNEEHEVFYDNKIEKFKEYKNFISTEEFYPEPSARAEKGFGEGTGLK